MPCGAGADGAGLEAVAKGALKDPLFRMAAAKNLVAAHIKVSAITRVAK